MPAVPQRKVAPFLRPPVLEHRRGALLSATGHCVVLTVLATVGVGTRVELRESPLIVAELVTALEPNARRATADAPAAPEAPPEPAEVAVEPAPTVEQETPALPPPPRAPEQTAPQERVVEPPPELPPVEQVAELPEPPVEIAPDEPVEPAAPAEVAEVPPEVAPEIAPPAPRRALASREERAVRRRLESWAGTFAPDEDRATMAWRDAGQAYTAVLKRLPAADAMGMEQMLVELATERDGEKLVAELRMNRIAFSNFAQFIDRWDPQVQIHDDLIDGRFHSNTEIRVSRDRGAAPVFTGRVTVAAGDVRTDGIGYLNRQTMFPAGLETRVRRIMLPARAAAFDDGSVPADRLQRIGTDSLVTFHADGTFEASAIEDDVAPERGTLGEEPYYLVADDEVTLRVRGTVNGKVLVYSRDRIVIVDDLRYAADPRMPGADDYLGLVAERSVEIDEPEVTGPGDLEVHASIYARNRFTVRSYRSERSGTLIVRGSVTAGSVSATEPRFATRIEFDDRLTTMRAPGFPLSDRYELDSMAGEWRVLTATP